MDYSQYFSDILDFLINECSNYLKNHQVVSEDIIEIQDADESNDEQLFNSAKKNFSKSKLNQSQNNNMVKMSSYIEHISHKSIKSIGFFIK